MQYTLTFCNYDLVRKDNKTSTSCMFIHEQATHVNARNLVLKLLMLTIKVLILLSYDSTCIRYNENFIGKHFHIFSIFLLKTLIFGTRSHNLCFRAKIRKKKVYPCTTLFFYIKVGFQAVYMYISWARFPDDCEACLDFKPGTVDI